MTLTAPAHGTLAAGADEFDVMQATGGLYRSEAVWGMIAREVRYGLWP